VIIPVYNESNNLKSCIEILKNKLDEINRIYEIIIAEDGSTDGTQAIARELTKHHEDIVFLHSDKRLGRGKALNRAFKACNGKILVYMDVDLSTDLKHLLDLILLIEKGANLATGSRILKESNTKRPISREIASRCYNFLARLLFGIPIHDMQCGFKAFDREALLAIIDDIQDDHWFWDTECIIRSYMKGYKIVELPVDWKYKGDTKVHLTNDARDMGTKLIKLRWKLGGLK
jgi:glycosyltransferase involved in cell wall biosynthesis